VTHRRSASSDTVHFLSIGECPDSGWIKKANRPEGGMDQVRDDTFRWS
jgi:hypothetical protein